MCHAQVESEMSKQKEMHHQFLKNFCFHWKGGNFILRRKGEVKKRNKIILYVN